jgi:hypothetical protein
MSLTTFKGKIISYVDLGHSGGYSSITSLLVESSDGGKLSFASPIRGRSDIMNSFQSAYDAGDDTELFIEKPFWPWFTGSAQIFGLKTEHISHYDGRNLSLRTAALIPVVLLILGAFWGFLGSVVLAKGDFLFMWFMAMVITTVFAFPLWVWLPLSLISTVGVLAKRIDRHKTFYGSDPRNAQRIKAMEPVSVR